MKLTLVTETYPPEVNGVAMTLSRLVAGVRALGGRVQVIRPRQAAEAVGPATGDEWIVPGLPIPFYRSLRVGLPAGARLRAAWRQSRPDLVHIATEGPLGWSALRAAHALGIPVTSGFHTNFDAYGGHYGLQLFREPLFRYLRWFHNRTRRTLVPARDLQERLQGEGFENVAVVARGVDTRLFDPARRSAALRSTWGVREEDPVAIYVGRLAPEKNLGLAVEAFLALQARCPGARFVLVGDGPERASLQSAYPGFHFAGTRRGEELAAHYASAEVFLFPSVTETFGNVVTEAMASGLVVLAFDYAAAREHVHNRRNGRTVAPGDRAAFVAAAGALAGERSAWAGWAAEARRTALELTWARVVARFVEELSAARAEAGPLSPGSAPDSGADPACVVPPAGSRSVE